MFLMREARMIPEDFWSKLFLGCLLIVGIWNAFGKGMVFERLGDYLHAALPKYARMPLYDCPMCMASVHGSWLWLGFGGSWLWWPIFVVALSGTMKLVAIEFLNRDG